MQTHLSPEFADTPDGEEAQAIIRKCVHCGFCNATCPTYQLLGDELAGPLEHRRKVLMLRGCVQPSMMPNIDIAAARVLDAAGIQAVYAGGTGCCGAVRTHLGDHHGGLDDMRRNIDAWLPLVSAGGAQAIVTSASACSLAIKEYGHALSGDAEYADKAARISAMACDLSELLPELVPALKGKLRLGRLTRPAVHPPPTLPPT